MPFCRAGAVCTGWITYIVPETATLLRRPFLFVLLVRQLHVLRFLCEAPPPANSAYSGRQLRAEFVRAH